jgi:hypothetical protein
MGDQPVARPLPAQDNTQNKCTPTCMPEVGFEPTISVFERAKTVHALDCAATVCDRHIRSHRCDNLKCNSTLGQVCPVATC